MQSDKHRILIIDDDSINRTLMATCLEELGFTVHEAEDGMIGLEILQEMEFDLVLLDLLMPVMDGFEVLARMKSEKRLRHLPVIVTSGEMDQESIVRCIQMGAVDYMTKPCDPVLLHIRVRNVFCSEGAAPAPNRNQAGTMLVVDDDTLYRTLLTTSLEEKGYIVAEAENGKQAWEMIQAGSYDLVFLDLLMPEMDGFEVLERIKSDGGTDHIPVIVVSGENDMESLVRCIEAGAADFLCKPFDPAVLHARVNASLAVKRLRDQERAYFENIQEERRKSEQLLLNILPKPILDRLKQKEEIIADSFEDVTVMFADLVGFTELAGRIPPIELVNLLNTIFSAFDRAAARNGLEKIKTIGDAYMVVGGLPVSRPDHVEAVADLALEVMAALPNLQTEQTKSLAIRIGIHTGPVVAGIIGTHKFSYDLWGNTVNIASRMESHGVPGAIHVSSEVYEQLKDRYRFESRGIIDIKGKGEMETWLLKGKKGDDR